MTTDDRKLAAFFGAVVNVLAYRAGAFHYPGRACFDGGCGYFGVVLGSPAPPLCNWKNIHVLAKRFFERGPDVNTKWKADACITGFVPEVLHDILLGVFIGGDGERAAFPSDEFHDKRAAMTAAMIATSQNRKNTV